MNVRAFLDENRILDKLATKPKGGYDMRLVGMLGILYEDMDKQRRILISKHLRIKGIVDIVDGYHQRTFASSAYKQIPEYRRRH